MQVLHFFGIHSHRLNSQCARMTTASMLPLVEQRPGGIPLAKRVRKGAPLTEEEWRNSPQNPGNHAKISEEENQRIAEEALAEGEIWEMQERINTRRRAERDADIFTVLSTNDDLP